MKLSVLDYAVVDENCSVEKAMNDSVELAKLADNLGYVRFWVAEHHNVPALANSSAELMIMHLLNQTKNIQIGSGGIMLPHYSAYKVSEWYNTLQIFFPNRVNIGVGNNAGTFRVRKLMNTKKLEREDYNKRITDLLSFISSDFIDSSDIVNPKPSTINKKPLWLLSASESSATLAKELKQNYAYGLFLNQAEDALAYAKDCLTSYKENNDESYSLISALLVIGEDEKEVQDLLRTLDVWLLAKNDFTEFSHFPSVETAKNYKLSEEDKKTIDFNRSKIIFGTLEQVVEQLDYMKNYLEVDEIMVVPLVPTIEQRKKTLQKLAKYYNLKEDINNEKNR